MNRLGHVRRLTLVLAISAAAGLAASAVPTGARAQLVAQPENSPVDQSGVGAIAAKGNEVEIENGDDLQKLSADPNHWVMSPKNYANTRFSALDQIDTGNVGQMVPVWAFSLGDANGQEAAPLVIGDTMYVVNGYAGQHPDGVFALDAATGALKWSYTPPYNPATAGIACCGLINRGIAYDNGKIFLNTMDDYAIALDAKTGKVVWHTKLGDIDIGESITISPLVVKGKVIIGNSGGELGVRGWILALDENTGKIVWKAYNTGPDKDVLIGKDFHSYYDWENGKDLGVSSWQPEGWKHGGATAWGWISYDPKLDLIYYGTSNPGPWNPAQRPGANLWASTVFARDPDTGMAKWATQIDSHDLWDYDETMENVLATIEVNGKSRDVLMRAPKNGYVFVMDRKTGQILTADPYDTITTTTGVDLETGKLVMNPKFDPTPGHTLTGACPTSLGGKDWQPSSFSPETGLLYIPHAHICMNRQNVEARYIAGTPYVGAIQDLYAGPGDGHRGELAAWDPVKRKKVWAIHERFPVYSGTMATAGGLVFYGTLDRWFKAVDAETGKTLWLFRMPSGIVGQPVTYAEGGRQYVAVLSGIGGGVGGPAVGRVNILGRNGGLGGNGLMQDLPAYTAGASTLMVFALPQPAQGEAPPQQ